MRTLRTLSLAVLVMLVAAPAFAQCRDVYWYVAASPVVEPQSSPARHRLASRTPAGATADALVPLAAETETLLAEMRLELPDPLRGGTVPFLAVVRVYEVWKDCAGPIVGRSGPTPWGLALAATKEEAEARATTWGATSAIFRLPDYGTVTWARWAFVFFDPRDAVRLGRNF